MLGRSEVLWVSLLVGLLVGRPAHIAYSFTQASLPDRPDRVLQAVRAAGRPPRRRVNLLRGAVLQIL